MNHTLTLKAIEPITHDTYRLVFNRPADYQYLPGQATNMALDKDGWRDEKRPFTFTSLPGADNLEFTIKSYPSHDGVTEQIAKLTAGSAVLIGEPWGAIEDRGPGVIIAGGAGITPFIAILRYRYEQHGSLNGYHLLFANSEERDIILRDELESMSGLETTFILSEEDVPTLYHGQIDKEFLAKTVADFSKTFYVCGPPPMEDAVTQALKARGVVSDKIVTEDHE